MRTIVSGAIIAAVALFTSPALSQDVCKDILVNGSMKRTELRNHVFFHQVLASEYTRKTNEEIDQDIALGGNWGDVFGGQFNKEDVKRYMQEIRSKLDVSTVYENEASMILSSGDPDIVGAWRDCIVNKMKGGVSMRFEAKSPTLVLLHFEWYAYPLAGDTRLKQDIKIPNDIRVESGQECLTARNPIKDKVPCTVNLRMPSGERELLLAANFLHGAADAYLPQRRILVAQRKPWKPQPGEKDWASVYAFADHTAGPPVSVSPEKDWSFIDATMKLPAQLRDGPASHSRCEGKFLNKSPSYITFFAFMAPDISGDNKCFTTLVGETIHWEPQDGLGLKSGAAIMSTDGFKFSGPMSPAERALRENLEQ
jgi:hypothetical protein